MRLSPAHKAPFGGYWWLAKTCLFLVTQPLISQLLTKFCSVKQIPDGTKTGQNHRKIKSRTPCSEYPHLNICYSSAKVQICPVKNESKRIKFTSIVHFLFSCTTVDNTNRFCPDWTGWHQKAVLKSVSWLLTATSGENVSGCTDILPEVLPESEPRAPLNTES